MGISNQISSLINRDNKNIANNVLTFIIEEGNVITDHEISTKVLYDNFVCIDVLLHVTWVEQSQVL